MEQYRDSVFDEMLVKSALKYRRIPFIEEFTRESCYKIMYYMNKIKEQDDKVDLPKDKRIIQIDISSYGGCVYSCLGLISLIESFKEEGYTIITNVQSYAMSCGYFLTIVGSKRKMARYGTLMMHQVQSGSYGELQRMEEDVEETARLWNIFCEVVTKYTKFTMEELEDMKRCKKDMFIDANTALEKGCIDEIY